MNKKELLVDEWLLFDFKSAVENSKKNNADYCEILKC